MRTLLALLLLLVLLVLYVVWTAGRLDRLHARVDAAWAALDAQLVRRAAAVRALAGALASVGAADPLERAALAAMAAEPGRREAAENELSRALSATLASSSLAEPAALAELRTSATRVALARSFHNAAVRDTRAIRLRRLPRALRLAGHRAVPEYFEIDDTRLAGQDRGAPLP